MELTLIARLSCASCNALTSCRSAMKIGRKQILNGQLKFTKMENQESATTNAKTSQNKSFINGTGHAKEYRHSTIRKVGLMMGIKLFSEN